VTDTFILCRECLSEGHEAQCVPVLDPPTEGIVDSGRWLCLRCFCATGVWIDWGTLDLGLYRDQDANVDNDFEILAAEG